MSVVAWWSTGPQVGTTDGGTISVMLGHTNIGGYGVFNDIGSLPVGTPVTVTNDQQTAVKLVVLQVVDGIDKKDPLKLASVLSNPPKGSISALATCSGIVQKLQGYGSSHQYNTVVFLGLAGQEG